MSTLETLLSLTENFSGGEAITLHPERCLNTRFRQANCTRCANACPAEGAISVSDGRPALNHDACLHCGLCLHVCPTEAFDSQNSLSDRLIKTTAALPTAVAVDLLCPRHPAPETGPAPYAVQSKRCLAALSSAALLELSLQNKEIWLDDTHCAACPLGKTHPFIVQAVAEANAWGALLKNAPPLSLRSKQADAPETARRPLLDANKPPVSRRGFFASFKEMAKNAARQPQPMEMLKAGQSVPVSNRLPQSVPPQRARILSLIEKNPLAQNTQAPITASFPVSDVTIDPQRCTACELCARFCPTGALQFLSDGQSFALTFQASLCLGTDCNICQLACPEKAVSLPTISITPDLLTKRPLVAGELTECKQCGQLIAAGSALPDTCFACRPKNIMASTFF